MRIRSKLLCGFAIVGLVITAAGPILLRATRDTERAFSVVADETIPTILALEDLRLAGLRERAAAAIDATGAGDAFTGALLAELARGQTLAQSVRFANAAAALSTLGYGAIAPLPRRDAVAAAAGD